MKSHLASNLRNRTSPYIVSIMMAEHRPLLPQHWFQGLHREFARKCLAAKFEMLRDMSPEIFRTLDKDAILYHTECDLIDAQFFGLYQQLVISANRSASETLVLNRAMLHTATQNIRSKPWRRRHRNVRGTFVELARLHYLFDIKSCIVSDMSN
jgi:hypothetical protein